jgi:hypothetical protein
MDFLLAVAVLLVVGLQVEFLLLVTGFLVEVLQLVVVLVLVFGLQVVFLLLVEDLQFAEDFSVVGLLDDGLQDPLSEFPVLEDPTLA